MSQLCPVNAERFIDYADKSLVVGNEPKLGACVVWQKGATKSGSDGAGHVAIVEQINEDGSIVTSESGYNCNTPFWTKTRKNDGNWGQNSQYKFLGFIYQKQDYEPEPAPVKATVTFEVDPVQKGCKGEYVKQVQAILKGLGYYTGTIDGIAGTKTSAAIKSYQQKEKLYLDGIWGVKCWEHWLGV